MREKRQWRTPDRAATIIALLAIMLAWTAPPLAAQSMQRPVIEPVTINWAATDGDFNTYRATIATARARGNLSLLTRARIALLKLRFASLRSADLQASVNELIGERFRRIAESPTPVLLPFDTPRYLSDRVSADGAGPTSAYLNGFSSFKYFRPGPAGYDASFIMPAAEVAKIAGVTTAGDVAVTLAGSSLFYVLTNPSPPIGDIDTRFPNLSPTVTRVIHERALRFSFFRYGAPYLVSIDCRPQGTTIDLIPCEQADKIAERFLQSLQLVGGAPPKRQLGQAPPDTVDRPRCPDRNFTYRAPGDLTPGSGYKNYGGKVDYTVYARMQFPIAASHAYANSQVFNNVGECFSDPPDNITTVPEPKLKGDTYACKQNPKKLLTFFEGAQGNYAYPWQDNFCESRDWPLGQCPGGNGHQGQDVRSGRCFPKSETDLHCEPYHHRVNAVREGIIQRERGKEALYLVINTATEHIRIRYLHMNPAQMDRDGMLTGREVSEGERLGLMGNFFDGKEGGTTYHLHIDLQVPTRDGWLYVSPYMTLVAAYERMLGRFGTEIKVDGTVAAPPAGYGCK